MLTYDIKPPRIKEISFISKYNYYEALVGLHEPLRIINLKAIDLYKQLKLTNSKSCKRNLKKE